MKEWLDTHSQVRTMLRVFAYTFGAVFVPSLLGWFADVQQWADPGNTGPFPSIAVVGRAAIAAMSGAFAAILAGIWNAFSFTKSPTYVDPPADELAGAEMEAAAADYIVEHPDAGESTIATIAFVLVIVVAVLWLVSTYR